MGEKYAALMTPLLRSIYMNSALLRHKDLTKQIRYNKRVVEYHKWRRELFEWETIPEESP
jgi:hypothetical protein